MQIAGKDITTGKLIITVIIGLIILASLALAVFFYTKYRNTISTINNPADLKREETQKLLEIVGKIIELPDSEEPTVATVTDSEKLKAQQFFINSQNGDKVIIYSGTKKAILYRPSTGKIIDVAPISIGSSSATPNATPSTYKATASVILLNGTTTAGLTQVYEEELKNKAPNIQVLSRGNARNQQYAKSLLIDVTGNNTEQAANLAKALGISLDLLPEGENASPSADGSADYIIILGEDKK